MKLIILGNGFDLHHKFKTSFYDFREHLKNSKNDKDQNLISKIDELIGVSENTKKEHLLWNDFETIIGKIMQSAKYNKNVPSLIEDFTQRFYQYLINISRIKTPDINKTLATEFETASTILTFNYTSFYSTYVEKSAMDIFHIHGNLSEDDLPIIGYYYPGTYSKVTSLDYSVRFEGRLIHKPALAYKQNEIDLDARITKFTSKWKNKITEITIIGYSFGLSDHHVYKILNGIMIKQINDINVPSSRAKNIKLIKLIIYNYKEVESKRIVENIKTNLSKLGRRFSINVTGVGFTPQEKDILTFELKNY